MVAADANAPGFAANERRTAERRRITAGSAQLKNALVPGLRRKRAVRATGLLPAGCGPYPSRPAVCLARRGRGAGVTRDRYIYRIYQLMLLLSLFLDTYPDKYYFPHSDKPGHQGYFACHFEPGLCARQNTKVFCTPFRAARRVCVASHFSRTARTFRFLRAVRVQTACANNAWWDRR